MLPPAPALASMPLPPLPPPSAPLSEPPRPSPVRTTPPQPTQAASAIARAVRPATAIPSLLMGAPRVLQLRTWTCGLVIIVVMILIVRRGIRTAQARSGGKRFEYSRREHDAIDSVTGCTSRDLGVEAAARGAGIGAPAPSSAHAAACGIPGLVPCDPRHPPPGTILKRLCPLPPPRP
jgi:hypothetical protein